MPETGDGTDSNAGEMKGKLRINLFRILCSVSILWPARTSISLGYNYKTRTDMATYSRSFISGFSLGGGFRLRNLAINLALAQPQERHYIIFQSISTIQRHS